jgi:CMP-N-acetylneuraminic acid synthetase
VVDAWAASKVRGTVWLSTDAPALLEGVPDGVQVHRRRPEDATDEQSTEDLLRVWAEECGIPCEPGDVIVVLQPTSPLMDAEDIADIVGVIAEPEAHGWAASHSAASAMQLAGPAGDVVRCGGGIYAVRADYFHRTGRLLSGDATLVPVDWPESLDIDTQDDWDTAEAMVAAEAAFGEVHA